jgi:hypothetical protein
MVDGSEQQLRRFSFDLVCAGNVNSDDHVVIVPVTLRIFRPVPANGLQMVFQKTKAGSKPNREAKYWWNGGDRPTTSVRRASESPVHWMKVRGTKTKTA